MYRKNDGGLCWSERTHARTHAHTKSSTSGGIHPKPHYRLLSRKNELQISFSLNQHCNMDVRLTLLTHRDENRVGMARMEGKSEKM